MDNVENFIADIDHAQKRKLRVIPRIYRAALLALDNIIIYMTVAEKGMLRLLFLPLESKT